MKFGIFFSYQRLGRPELTDDTLYPETLREAIAADRVGFDQIWLPEHHLTPYFQAPSAFMTAVQIGLNVGCRVGTMASVLPYHHPLRVAGEIAVADRILEGRFDAGLARGAWAHEFRKFGLDFNDSGQRFWEEVEILLKAWHADTAIDHSGQFYQFDDAIVWPRPVQRPHPPLWIAAQSDQSIARAAALGLNVATWPHHHPNELIRHRLEVFRDAVAEREEPETAVEQEFSVLRVAHVSDDQAERERALQVMLDNFRVNRLYHNDTAEDIDEHGYVAPRPVPDEPSIEQLADNLLVGDAREVLDRVEEYAALGVDQLILHLSFGLEHDVTIASIERFGNEVIRPFRERREGRAAS